MVSTRQVPTCILPFAKILGWGLAVKPNSTVDKHWLNTVNIIKFSIIIRSLPRNVYAKTGLTRSVKLRKQTVRSWVCA